MRAKGRQLPSAVTAAKDILDRTLGQAAKTLTVQGDTGGPVRVVHVYANVPGLPIPEDPAPRALPEPIEAERGESPEETPEYQPVSTRENQAGNRKFRF
jgi:hypothetical protein